MGIQLANLRTLCRYARLGRRGAVPALPWAREALSPMSLAAGTDDWGPIRVEQSLADSPEDH